MLSVIPTSRPCPASQGSGQQNPQLEFFHNPNRCHRLPRPVVVLDPVYGGKASCPDFPHGTPYACCRLPRPVAVCWSLCTVAGFAAPGLATPSPFCFPTLISIFIHIHSFHCRWPKPVVLCWTLCAVARLCTAIMGFKPQSNLTVKYLLSPWMLVKFMQVSQARGIVLDPVYPGTVAMLSPQNS